MKYEFSRPLAVHEIGQRENQEDCIYPAKGEATENDRLFVLCDGMGGHQAGEVASQAVCQTVSEYIKTQCDPTKPFTDDMLRTAINTAYDSLDEKDTPETGKNPGTTFVFLYFHVGGLMAAHLGDSRYYHIRPRTGEILYRSKDHSLATMRFESGELSLDEMKTMSGKNVVLRALIQHQDERDTPDIVHIKDIKPDDWFYMCSDGMLENMNDEELLNILSSKELSDEQKCSWLVTSTDGNKDNHSAYLIHVTGVMSELIDEGQPDDEAEARNNNKVFLAEQNRDITPPKKAEENKGQDGHMPLIIVDSDGQTDIAPRHSAPKSHSIPAWKWAILTAVIVLFVILSYLWFGSNQQASPETPTIIYKEYNTPKTYQPNVDEQPIRSNKKTSADVTISSSPAKSSASPRKVKDVRKEVKTTTPQKNQQTTSGKNLPIQEEAADGKSKPGFHIDPVPEVDMDDVKSTIKSPKGKKSDNSSATPKENDVTTEKTKGLKEA